MPSTKVIRKRISSVKNTQKITKAMKMVAAAKLRRAQNQIHAFRPYAKGLSTVVSDLVSHLGIESSVDLQPTADEKQAELLKQLAWFFEPREETRIRLLIVTSDRGLCGGFNGNILRRTEQFLVEKEHCLIEVDIIGRKGRDYVQRRMRERQFATARRNRWQQHRIHSEHTGMDSKNVARYAKELAQSLQEARQENQADAVYVIYNQFLSAGRQVVTLKRLLPLLLETHGEKSSTDFARLDYLYEPSKEDVFTHLLPLYFETELHQILLDSIASEFGAQMSAMDNASRNAKDMISRLTLQMNRARQAAITKELMEIIGGAEALKG